jgi:predicted O-linked N-acetylglucosamine transferase (SPINDLY family)
LAKFSLSQALTLADAHLAAGRLTAAETVGRLVAQAAPDDPRPEVLLASVCQTRGDRAGAVEHLQRACALQPDNLALWIRLVAVGESLGRWEVVKTAAQRALELHPNAPDLENSLANALFLEGQLDQAETLYRHALAAAPQMARVWSNLGALLQRKDQPAEAERACRRALALDPLQPQAFNNLATTLRALGRLDEAEAACRQALTLHPGFAEATFNLGCVLQSRDRTAEAEAAYRQTLALSPGYEKAAYNLATTLDRPGHLADAEKAYRQILAQNPQHASAAMNLGNLLHNASRFDEADEQYRQAMGVSSHKASGHANLLLNAQYRPGVTAAGLFAAHCQWGQQHADPLTATAMPAANSPEPDRPLRLGLVSADLGRHPVGYFLASTLETLNRELFPVYCYSDRTTEDDLSQRIQATAHTWRRTAKLSHDALAEQIQADGIDMLFDLAGHMAGNRLLLFARRPAPVQITWIGYPGTTGLSAIDYLLADRHHVPPGAEQFCQEQVLRMPEGYVCYAPPDDAPPIGPQPAVAAGYVTFACFNKPAKINVELAALWAQILDRLPTARLLLKYPGLDDPTMQARYRQMFRDVGVAAERLELSGESSHKELLDCYNRVDVALDTRPYSGGLTTCEALWMGVPVITWPGATFAGRHALSHLSSAGLEGTIATSGEDYVARAVAWASDLERLAELRATLRARMLAAPLCNAPRFAAEFQRLLRRIWRAWCQRPSATPAGQWWPGCLPQ